MTDMPYQNVWCIYKVSKLDWPVMYWFNDKESELIEDGLILEVAKMKALSLNEKYAPLTPAGYPDIQYKVCLSKDWHNCNDNIQLEIKVY